LNEVRIGFEDYSPPSGSSSATSPMVPFGASCNMGPNVASLSLLTLITGVSLVWFVSHQVTTTLSPSEYISTLEESKSVVLLKLILSPKVCPPSTYYDSHRFRFYSPSMTVRLPPI
jgi:hypothetical protein